MTDTTENDDADRSSTQERWVPCPIHASQNTNSGDCRECRLAGYSCCPDVGFDACVCEHPWVRTIPPGKSVTP